MEDHDLLIKIETLLGVVIKNQENQATVMQGIDSRVSNLEAKDRGDSERIGSILEAVKATANNSSRISEAHSRVDQVNIKLGAIDEALNKRMDDLFEEMKAMRNKSNILDAINAVGVVISGIVGAIFGSR